MLKKKIKKKDKIFFRYAKKKDLKLIFNWANDHTVRKFSKKKKISISEHEKWFHKKLNNNYCKMFIFFTKKNFIGQIRIDKEKKRNLISYSIDKKFRGMGYGKEMIKRTLNFLKPQLKFKEIFAKVDKKNVASVKIFEALTFECYYRNKFYYYKKKLY